MLKMRIKDWNCTAFIPLNVADERTALLPRIWVVSDSNLDPDMAIRTEVYRDFLLPLQAIAWIVP
jgi:hypothetical protein